MFAPSSCVANAKVCPEKLQYQRLNSGTRSAASFTRDNALKPRSLRRTHLANIYGCDVRNRSPCSSAGCTQQSTCSAYSSSGLYSEVANADIPTRNHTASPYVLRACMLALLCAATAWAGLAMASHASSAGASTSSNLLSRVFDFVMHLDTHLTELIAEHGSRGVYGVLFGIVFAETGLVITPFLPGDSLLFAAGCLPALNFWALLATFITAASLGDAFNYMIGSTFGKKALQSNFVKGDYVAKTEKFYTKYGVKTIILARFVPIVRTFAPFVAGIASMDYTTFAIYNVGGAVLWSALLTGLGRAFGQLPVVQNNFSAVCAAIVVVSLVPVVIEAYLAHKEVKQDGSSPQSSAT